MRPCTAEMQAHLDGQVAALRRVPFTENPHPLSCANSRAWSRGYRHITETEKAPA